MDHPTGTQTDGESEKTGLPNGDKSQEQVTDGDDGKVEPVDNQGGGVLEEGANGDGGEGRFLI